MYFESLGADLEAVHRLYGRLCRGGVVVGDESEALGQIRLFVDKHFGRDDVAEGHECRGQVRVGELLWQVVDEEVASLGTCKWKREGISSMGFAGIIIAVCLSYLPIACHPQ